MFNIQTFVGSMLRRSALRRQRCKRRNHNNCSTALALQVCYPTFGPFGQEDFYQRPDTYVCYFCLSIRWRRVHCGNSSRINPSPKGGFRNQRLHCWHLTYIREEDRSNQSHMLSYQCLERYTESTSSLEPHIRTQFQLGI